jgi:hypothetical protein
VLGWWLAGLFAIPWINWPMPVSAHFQWFGALEALILVICLVGSVVWVVWPPKISH